MSNVSAEFHFDFGSPNAYLAHRMIPQVEARTGVRFSYVPVLLGGLFKLANNRSPMEAYAAIPNKLAYERLEMQRFIERHGLERFRPNPHFPVNTLAIMRGAVAARHQDVFAPYVETVYVAMWEQGRDMADPDVIRATLQEAGLDAQALMDGAQDPAIKNELLANTQSAFDRGAFGSPTFFVGDDMYFGKDRLRDVEEAILRRRG